MKSFLCGSGDHGSTSRRLWDRSTDLSRLGSGRLEPSFLIDIRWRGVLSEVGDAEGKGRDHKGGELWPSRSTRNHPMPIYLLSPKSAPASAVPDDTPPCLAHASVSSLVLPGEAPPLQQYWRCCCCASLTPSSLPHRAQLRALPPPSRSLSGSVLTWSHYTVLTALKLRNPPASAS